MAKASCKVKIKWRGWNRKGYAEVMDGPGVQAMLDKRAEACEAQANASFAPHAGEGAGYACGEFKGVLAKGRVVYTQTPHANASERRHNRLQAMFGGL